MTRHAAGSPGPEGRRPWLPLVVVDEPSLGPRRLLLYGLIAGLLGGTLEASFRAARHLVTGLPADGFHWELFWMAPLAAGIASLAVACGLAGLVLSGVLHVGPTTATALFTFIATYGVIQTEGIPLHPASELALAAGLAAVVARAARARAATVERGLRAAPWALVSVTAVLGAFAIARLPGVTERRAHASLTELDRDLPNIVLIILDTVRAANLGLYGYERPTTPEMTEWAESGVVYERAYTTAPWTLPAHATLFTGRYPSEVDTGVERALDESFPTLAEVLADNGYETAGFVANLLYTTPSSGLDRGFARYQAHPITVEQILRSAWLSRLALKAVGGELRDEKGATRVTGEFFDWLEGRGSRPFFAFLNYFDAHEPYEPPEPFRTRFGPGPSEPWGTHLIPWHGAGSDERSRLLVRQWVERYDGAIAFLDHQLGLIRERLTAQGLLDDTIVIITSDHGEAWGEHGLIGHMNALYVPLLHVPLVVSYPGEIGPGQRVDVPVSLRDLPSTVLALAELDGSSLPGTSLIPPLGPSRPSPVLAELDVPPALPSPHAPIRLGDMRSAIEEDFHYILNGDGSEELYDLSADPGQENDLSATPGLDAVLNRLRATVDAVGFATVGPGPPAGE